MFTLPISNLQLYVGIKILFLLIVRNASTHHIYISLNLLPTFLNEQIECSTSRIPKTKFSAKEAVFIFFFLCLKKMIVKENNNHLIKKFFNEAKNFVIKYLQDFFERFHFLFETVFIFELLLKNFEKIKLDELEVFGSKLFAQKSDNLRYDGNFNESYISKIDEKRNNFSINQSEKNRFKKIINDTKGKKLKKNFEEKKTSRILKNNKRKSKFINHSINENSVFGFNQNFYEFPFETKEEFLFSLFSKTIEKKKIINKTKQLKILNPNLGRLSEFGYIHPQYRKNYISIIIEYLNMYKELLKYFQSKKKEFRSLKNHINRMILISQSLFRIFLKDSKGHKYTPIVYIFGKKIN